MDMAVLPPLVWDIRNASWPGACWQTPTGAALGNVPSDECDGNAAEAPNRPTAGRFLKDKHLASL